jgi:hypothetical protein
MSRKINKMNEINEILNKIKEKLNIKKDKELAEILNIKQQTLTNWKKRNKIPYREILIMCSKYKININDILISNKESIDGVVTTLYENVTGNKININNNNNSSISINNLNDDLYIKICNELKKLNTNKREYFYHLMKAENLKDNL